MVVVVGQGVGVAVGQPLGRSVNFFRPLDLISVTGNGRISEVFGALARVVPLWGNVPFPKGSIGEHVLGRPARKGHAIAQRAGRETPKPATPSTGTLHF